MTSEYESYESRFLKAAELLTTKTIKTVTKDQWGAIYIKGDDFEVVFECHGDDMSFTDIEYKVFKESE